MVSILQDSHFCFVKKLAAYIEEGIQIQALDSFTEKTVV